MADPRNANCREFHLSNGLVDGVNLDYLPMPQGTYELKSITLIPEAQAGGQTVATVTVLDRYGVPAEAPVVLAYPWGGGADMPNQLLPGNPARPVQHMITNGYDAAHGDKGPLAIYVSVPGNVRVADSDVIGGLGLPNNRHVCYSLVYRERGAVEPGPDPEPGTGDLAETNALLRELIAAIKAGFRL